MPSSVPTAPQRNPMIATVQRVGTHQKVSADDANAAGADLRITMSGGTAGTPAQAGFVVTLNTSVASEGTAHIIDETAASAPVPAKKSGNRYIFEPVHFAEPGATGTRVFRITNVRVNANGITGGGSIPANVVAAVSISGSTGVPLLNAEQHIAVVDPARKM